VWRAGAAPRARGTPAPVKRVLWALVALAGVTFAVQGGEYGTTDLLSQRARRRVLAAEVDSLRRQVDSLQRVKKRLQADPSLQERIAREEFGMVRGDKELLYRFAEPRGDSARAGGARPEE
jgi:cell division protein FtsB